MPTKKGHRKYIETPEKMWEYFSEYKTECKKNPIREHDFVGKDAHSVHREKERCLTMAGFECWLADENIIIDVGDYFENANNKYNNYSAICSRIKKNIRKDQIEGGMAGIYNPSITQRLNGLTERQEINHNQPIIVQSSDPNMSDEELKNMIDNL